MKSMRCIRLNLVIALMAMFAGALQAAEKVAGSATFSMASRVTLPVSSATADHTLLQSSELASQLQLSGETLNGCSVERTTLCDMVRGRGTCFGYQTTLASETDRLVTKYSGVILPDKGVDKKPTDLIMRGTWVVIDGTGKYLHYQGGGTYRGRFISDSEYTLEWSGEIARRDNKQ